MQDLTDAKRKFVQMARRKQAEHTAKVLLAPSSSFVPYLSSSTCCDFSSPACLVSTLLTHGPASRCLLCIMHHSIYLLCECGLRLSFPGLPRQRVRLPVKLWQSQVKELEEVVEKLRVQLSEAQQAAAAAETSVAQASAAASAQSASARSAEDDTQVCMPEHFCMSHSVPRS